MVVEVEVQVAVVDGEETVETAEAEEATAVKVVVVVVAATVEGQVELVVMVESPAGVATTEVPEGKGHRADHDDSAHL